MHKVITIFCFLLFAPLLYAQYWFTPLKSEMGTNLVESFCRDHKGYLWIGNQRSGLMRYNGYLLERILHNEEDSTSISSDEIKCICEDSDHTLWVGTKHGLNKYIPEEDRFIRYYFNNYPNAFYIEKIEEAPNNDLYVLTQNGIFIFNKKSNKFKRYGVSNNQYENYFTCIDWDKDGNTWCGTINTNGLYQFDALKNTFTLYPAKYDHPFKSGIKSLLIDSQNNFWYGHRGIGLASFHPESHKFTYYPIDKHGKGTSGSFITSFLEVDSTTIFIGIDQNGINVLDKRTNSFSYITDKDPTYGKLTSNGIYSLYKDNEDIIWVGTSRGGVCYSNPKEHRFTNFKAKFYKTKQAFSYYPYYGYNSCFYEDSNGIIWIGTDGDGVMTFNPNTLLFSKVSELEDIPHTKSIKIIRSIQEDSQNNIWIATWQGDIIKYDRKKNKYEKTDFHHPKDTHPFAHEIWSFFIDSKERYWIANPFGNVYIYKKQDELISSFYIGDSLLSSYDPLIHETADKNIILSLRNGIYNYNSKNKNADKIISRNNIVSLAFDTEDNFWVADDHGYLFHYNENGSIMDSVLINAVNGKALIKGLACYKNQIWISTNSGIIKYDNNTNKQYHYGEKDGLQGNQFFLQSVLKTTKGEIYMGGSNGFTCFVPEDIKNNTKLPSVYITDLTVYQNKNFSNQDTTILTKNVSFMDTIVLNWNNKQTLQFKFDAISFTNSFKNKFIYRLSGFESQWNYTDAFSRKATYTNLAPGSYLFEVSACNNDELWNTEGKSIKLIILPPFWKTKIFYLLITLLVIILIFSVIKYRERKIKRNSIRLKELVDKRTSMIEKQKEKLNYQYNLLEEKNKELASKQKKLQSQNNELKMHRENLEKMVLSRTEDLLKAKEKAEESERLKSSFLANMSHEIRTPMNAIVGFASLLNDSNLTEAERRNFISTITGNADVLLTLVEDILDFSIIESNQMKIRKTEFVLNDLLKSIYDSFVVNMPSKNVVLKLNKTIKQKKITLYSDEYRIRQIIVNLVSNAIKFTQKGYIEIGIRQNKNKDNIEIYVLDTGSGMSEEEQKLIFNQFVKLDKNLDVNKRGIGLGLAISKRLADLLGGSLNVKSQKNIGSEFIFTINT